jgi:hypothetical protein
MASADCSASPWPVDPWYSPSPFGRGRGEGQVEVGRALAGPILPYAEVKTAIGRASACAVPLPCRSCREVFGDEVGDDERCLADVKGIRARFGRAIRHGHALVLAQVFDP